MKLNIDIDKLIADRKAFDNFVYTPAEEALAELKKRWIDPTIEIGIPVPSHLEKGFKAIQYVCVITPNYQIRRYITIADALGLEPLIFEQNQDKFTSNNEWKHSLGKLRFFKGVNKYGKAIIEYLNIIDFNYANGKNISSIKTFWDEPLVDFHHNMFFNVFPKLNTDDTIFEASEWFKENGGTPKEYYRKFFLFLIKHAIQFENFMLDEKEVYFTKEIFLPAFIEVYEKTGLKPLIVALEPTETEGDQFWISYPSDHSSAILEKIAMKNK